MAFRILGAALAVAALAAGCSSDPCAQPASFASISSTTFKFSCALSDSCHNAVGHMNGLDLKTDPYTALVGVAPENKQALANGWKRVAPGDLANSYLYEKVTQVVLKDPKLGDRMPDTGQGLSGDTIQQIQCWIQQGAPNN